MTAGGAKRGETGPSSKGTWTAWSLLAFAALVLTALAVTPFVAERRVAGMLETTTAVLDPARHLAAELNAAHTWEMVAVQSFLLTGEGEDRQDWRLARQRSQMVMDSLTGYTENLGQEVRFLAFAVADAALQWRILVDPVLEERMGRWSSSSECRRAGAPSSGYSRPLWLWSEAWPLKRPSQLPTSGAPANVRLPSLPFWPHWACWRREVWWG